MNTYYWVGRTAMMSLAHAVPLVLLVYTVVLVAGWQDLHSLAGSFAPEATHVPETRQPVVTGWLHAPVWQVSLVHE